MSRIVLTERWVVLLQVQFIAPVANGAGVSLIMAYLNGNSIPDLLTFRSASQMYTYEHLQRQPFIQACPSDDHVTNLHSAQALLSCRTLLVKFVGTCCGVCANISLGPEAPTVHIGACVADNVTHLACGKLCSESSVSY